MTIQLNNINEIKRLDSQNMLGSLRLLGKQVWGVWGEAKSVKMPLAYKKINKVLVCGMGGSALGAHIVKTLFQKELAVPVEILNDYHLPDFVDNNTLIVISSYSGTTEEPVNAAKEALKRDCRIVVITTGGELAPWAKKNRLPALVFNASYNPCDQPRMGLGYAVGGMTGIFSKLELVKFGDKDARRLVTAMQSAQRKFDIKVDENINSAKQFARSALGRSIWYVGAEHLVGNAHVAANQMNENAKRFAGYFAIPEFNHHLMEGMGYPKTNKQNLLFILIDSNLYDKRVQKRYGVTKKVLEQNGIKYLSYKCVEKAKLGQTGEVLVLGSYISYYSALLEGIDPTAIPYVDYFKKELRK